MTTTTAEALSVTELTQAIKHQLESNFTALSVKGEVTNLRLQASGHYYFSLKDENAQISAVLFQGNARFAKHLPKMGDQVLIKGEINVYAPRGTYQIIVREIEHAGLGELLLKFHALKAKLEKMGWFDPAKKKPLPTYPKTIGVVTSPTGAVIQDILNVLKRRFPNFHLILNPVKVQGAGAAEEIAQAIDDFNRFGLADILIIGRGGGSLEDLWAFNEECVAAAIFRSKIPIVSAVGHETDVTIADCVADVRAPTPSAAAELSVKELHLQLNFLQETRRRTVSMLAHAVKQGRLKLAGIQRHPLFKTPYTLLADHFQRIDGVYEDLNQTLNTFLKEKSLQVEALKKHLQGLSPNARLKLLKEKMYSYQRALERQVSHQIQRKKEQLKPKELTSYLESQMLKKLKNQKEKLSQISSHLKSINPNNLLKKGYCIPFAEKDHSVIMSTHALQAGEKILLQMYDGSVNSTIDEVHPKHD
ncbi:MAG: exodeoxyribonuclease VII large subunit [Simkania sp.]|nr:exodeoxyribonuclease VII large subunit [Simkania sp.]MCP5490184.1 exodeoxyribonuclease VII large subunit [Chlamydiales bacterium]